MRTITRLLGLSLLVIPISAIGKGIVKEQNFIVNNNDTIVATISKREITRIAFESDIAFISSITGELEYTTKEQDLYLRPNVEKPINFFVKTADEHTYKFLVDANDLPAIQIFIKSNVTKSLDNKLVLYGDQSISEGLQKRIATLIDIALKPIKHMGFKFEQCNEYLGTVNNLSMQKVAEVSGMQLKAEVIMISNNCEKTEIINLNEFMDEEIMAVYVEKLAVAKDEKVKLIKIKG